MDKEKNRLIAVAAVIVVIIAIVAAALVLTGGDDRGGDDEPEDVLFELAVSSNEGGTVTPSGTTQLAEGTTQTITITPNSGFVVSDVLLDGESVGAVTSLEVRMDGNHTVEVVFADEAEPMPIEHTITASASSGGRISPSGDVKVADGADQTFTFTANGSYRVSQVTVDGQTVTVTGNSYTFENVTGDHSISVTFRYVGGGGGGTTPSVTLTGITVTNQPDRMSYLAGEEFDKTGMIITASYSNGTTETVEDYTYSPDRALTTDDRQITVTYQGRTTTVNITVIAEDSEIQSIEITAQPTKTHYFDDQEFNAAGMEVSAVYDGNVKIPLDSSMYKASEDEGTEETRTVTVTLLEDGSKTTTLTISRNNTIMDVEELKHFRDNVNNGNTYSGETVYLGAVIDLNNESWTPIGPNADDTNKFKGIFDGNNHTILKLNVQTGTGYAAAGFFGALNGTAKNFIIDGATVEHISAPGTGGGTDNGIAVVAGSIYPSGTIENVTVKNAIVEGNRYVGGIAGYVYGSINGCTVESSELSAVPDNLSGSSDNGDKVGGIVGYISTRDNGGNGGITDCTVKDVTISGYRNLGGIAGTSDKSPTGCTVENVTITHDRSVITTPHSNGNQSGIVLGTRTFTGFGDESNKVLGAVTTDDVDVVESAIALSDGEIKVNLLGGTYTPADHRVSVPAGKDVVIRPASESDDVVFDGQMLIQGAVDVAGITMNTAYRVDGVVNALEFTGVALTDNGRFSADDVTFVITLNDGTAVNTWWTTDDEIIITITDSVFDCYGQRPIRSECDVTVERCTFNDPYRYAVQMNGSGMTVEFRDNTINAGDTTDQPVYGIQLEGETYGCSDMTINGSGNTINLNETGKTAVMYYCECGKVECGHDPDVPSTITWNVEVEPVHKNLVTIATADQLMEFAKSVNAGESYENVMVQLTDNINLADRVWTPIGLSAQSGTVFRGTFDGMGHTITGLIIDTDKTTDVSAAGFFGVLNGDVKNVKFVGAKISHASRPYLDMNDPPDGNYESTNHGIGVVAGSLLNSGSITNVTVESSVVSGNRYVGGIVGYIAGDESTDSGYDVTVSRCSVSDIELTATPDDFTGDYDNGDKVGGIVGYMGYFGVSVTDCTASDVTITGYRDLGIIAGAIQLSSVNGFGGFTVNGSNTITVDQTNNSYGDKDECAGNIVGRVVTGTYSGTDAINGTVDIHKLRTVENASELSDALTAAGTDTFDTVVEIEADLDMTGITWTPVDVQGYQGAGVVTVNGNNKTISHLTAPLFGTSFAGRAGIVINDLTITDSTITGTNETGMGAFVSYADSITILTLDNCHLKDSSVTGTGDARVGGLIGWTSGYSEDLTLEVTVTDCSVENCKITANGSVGGIIGHAGSNAYTITEIGNCTVSGCELKSTDAGGWRVGVVVGTANVGDMTITDTKSENNNLSQTDKNAPEGQSNLYGRFVPDTTGKLTINGEKITLRTDY